MTDAEEISKYLDELLNITAIQDYPGALNGLQMTSNAPATKIAAAVDFSMRSLEACLRAQANFLIVHHGMFWSGTTPFVAGAYRRIRFLVENNIAVYSAHLPLDAHPEVGNNVLLANALGLKPTSGFAHAKGAAIGVAGECDLLTSDLVERARVFSANHGGAVVANVPCADRRTHRWGMCTGAGASGETLSEARLAGIDTLIVGEGPHWTAVAAEDDGIVVIYAGHYATETLGVQAIAAKAGEKFGIPWHFIKAPTGL